MDMKNYQKAAQHTSRPEHDRVRSGSLGLIGESGEVVDILKKLAFQGLDRKKARKLLLDELGDVLWYVAETCAGIDEDIARVDLQARALVPEPATLEAMAVRLVARACELNRALRRMEVDDYARPVAFPRLVGVYRTILDLCAALEVEVEYVAARNIRKLRGRYPEGFDPEISSARYEEDEEQPF